MDENSSDQFFERVREYVADQPLQIGVYEIHHEVARGGQGVVYKGIDTSDGQPVALKRSHDSGSIIQPNLVRGAELASLLEHPYILPILDIENEDETVWVITPWVDGLSLDKWCSDLANDDHSKIVLFLKICSAVIHAHGRGVIHRDLRPANILVRMDGTPCVLDFGIAKRVEGRASSHTMTQSGLSGDLHFLAPEMLKEERSPTDVRQDVYALGVILYTMLKGTHPLDRMSIGESVERVSSGKLFDSSIDQTLPDSIGVILRKATSSDLNARYSSVQEIVSDIRDDQRGMPIQARTHTKGYLFSRFVKRNRFAISIGIASAILLFSGAVVLGTTIERERGLVAANTKTLQLYSNLIDSITPSSEVGPASDGLGVLSYASKQIQIIEVGDSRDEQTAHADVQFVIGKSYSKLNREDLGLPHAQRAFNLYFELLGRDHVKTQNAGFVLVDLLILSSRLDAAEQTIHSMIDDIRVDAIENPKYLVSIALIMTQRRKSEVALDYYNRYLDVAQENTSEYIQALIARGTTFNQMGNPLDAVESLKRAHSISLDLLGPDHAYTLESRMYLIKSFQILGRFEEVRVLVDEILPEMTTAFGPNDPRTLRTKAFLTIAEVETGYPERAYKRATEMLEESRGLYPEGHWDIIQCKFLVAHAMLGLGRPLEVVELLESEILITESAENIRFVRKYQPRFWIAKAHNEQGNYQDAKDMLSPIMDELTLKLKMHHPILLLNQFEYEKALAGSGELSGLEERMTLLIQGYEETFGLNHPYTQRVESFKLAATGRSTITD